MCEMYRQFLTLWENLVLYTHPTPLKNFFSKN